MPGRPALFATTKKLLDHFNLKSLDELPSLLEFTETLSQDAEIKGSGEESTVSATSADAR